MLSDAMSPPPNISESAAMRPVVEAIPRKKVAIFIVTYNAVKTLSQVLDRIPEKVWDRVDEVFVFDDGSQDDTFLVGLGYKQLHGKAKLSIFKNEENLGYGGNQIRGYKYAIEQGHDIVALLHGDGQYAPEALGELLEPLDRGEADAVFGSRMMTKGAAREGGMPLYKYAGNRILTSFENAMLGTHLSEFHSGYRLYSTEALKKIPFDRNTDDFHFDTQIIIQLHAAGLRIVEKPIPTYYGDEICHVNGMKYAADVVASVMRYEAHELGLQHYPEYEVQPNYTLKKSRLSSHSQLLDMVGPTRQRVLDIGCGKGELGNAVKHRGHHVVGLDQYPPEGELDAFYEANLFDGLPEEVLHERFDTILFADVLEHLPDPDAMLIQAAGLLNNGGKILVSLPNAVHWSMRAQVAAGRFDYTNKGIMDRGHLRFFTRQSAERMFEHAGLRVLEHRTSPVPWENVLPRVFGKFLSEKVEHADFMLSRLRPNVFAYQHLFELSSAE
jgi:glycosyltransferase involved in cell wall biosynthesis